MEVRIAETRKAALINDLRHIQGLPPLKHKKILDCKKPNEDLDLSDLESIVSEAELQ